MREYRSQCSEPNKALTNELLHLARVDLLTGNMTVWSSKYFRVQVKGGGGGRRRRYLEISIETLH